MQIIFRVMTLGAGVNAVSGDLQHARVSLSSAPASRGKWELTRTACSTSGALSSWMRGLMIPIQLITHSNSRKNPDASETSARPLRRRFARRLRGIRSPAGCGHLRFTRRSRHLTAWDRAKDSPPPSIPASPIPRAPALSFSYTPYYPSQSGSTLNHVPDVPVSRIVTNVVAAALFECRRREKHQRSVFSQRHKPIGITRRNVKH